MSTGKIEVGNFPEAERAHRELAEQGMHIGKKPILHNPFLIFPLGIAVAMALMVGWSFTQSDREAINEPFFAFLLVLPLLAAAYSVWFPKHVRWFQRILTWVGTTALGICAAIIVLALSGMLLPAKRIPSSNYNSRHFRYSDYARAAQQRPVRAGEKAADETLYTLDEKKVSLSDLWKERPVVIEFGAVT